MNVISIVNVTCNQREYTRRCLASISEYTSERYELIVVDNGSRDGTVEYLKEVSGVAEKVSGERIAVSGKEARRISPTRMTVAVNAENRGFPAAANQAISVAIGQQIILLNNDTVVTSGWLTPMLRALESDPQIGMVGPCSNFVSGPQQIDVPYAGRGPVSIAECDVQRIHEFARAWGEANDGQIQEVDRLVGFCLLIRREVIDKIGLLDERFGIGNFEDDDYCRRARGAGFKLVIARDAFVHHYGGATFRASGVDFRALMARNERLYREKWGGGKEEVSGEQLLVSGQELRGISTHERPMVSLCMIARDNERTIGAALESTRHIVGEMVVVDTGSKDRTPKIAASLGARVFHFPWCDDFSAARNESIRHARGEWIFWMDTDDTMDAENGRKFQALVSSIASHAPSAPLTLPSPPAAGGEGDTSPLTAPSPTVAGGEGRVRGADSSVSDVAGFLMKVRCPGSGSNGRHGVVCVDHVKLFRNRPEHRFEFRIHEQILLAIRRTNGKLAFTDICIDHSGSDQSPEGRARKLERDLRILELEYRERPDHPFVLFNLGMTHENAGNFEKAIGFLWQSIGRSGDDESHLRKAYAILVSSYRQLGRVVTAFETCVKGLKQFGDDLELRFQQAQLYYALGRPVEAARAYEDLRAMKTSLHLSSVDPSLQGYRSAHNLAAIYAELGEASRAERLWLEVVEESPWFAPAWHGLVKLMSRDGKFDEALAYTDGMKLDPEMIRDAGRLRRSVLVDRGNVTLARNELDQAIVANPGDIELLEERCRLLFEHFPPAEAESGFRELLERDPENPAGYHNLGTIHYKLARYDAAACAYRRAIDFRPNCASTHVHLGYALREAGKVDEAIAEWRQALEIHPGDLLATAAIQEATSRT